MKAHFTIYVLFLLIVSSLYSCKSAKLSDAEEKQRIGEYYEAAAIYRKVYTKTSPKKRDLRGYIAYRMAECNRLINNTAKATSAYMNAIRYDYPDSTVYLRMGQMFRKTGRYPEAIKNYDIYMENDPSNLLAINGIQGCELAPGWKKNPTRYEVRRMDKFNSRRGEFSPMLAGDKYDQLYFASSRSKDKDAKVSAITGQNNNNLFLVKQDEKGAWLAPVELEDEVNTEYDEGTPSFSPDGNTMYYTYCAQDPEGPRTAEIYISTEAAPNGEKEPCDNRKRLGYRPRPSLHLAGRQILVFCIRRRRRFRRQGYFPCPGSGKRFRPDGEPRRRDQHAGRRDVPVCPGFRHPLFRVQRTSGNGWSRSVQGHARQYREVEGREPRSPHQSMADDFGITSPEKRNGASSAPTATTHGAMTISIPLNCRRSPSSSKES